MKKLYLIIAGISLFCALMNAQENVTLITDRSLFVAKDTIRFSAYLKPDPKLSKSDQSSVLYIELNEKNGEFNIKQKHPIINGFCNGNIPIPGNIPGGSYNLRAYTRWQRNLPSLEFTNLDLDIVNFKKNNTHMFCGINKMQDSSQTLLSHKQVKIHLDKKTYQPKETASVNYSIPYPDDSIQHLTVSIVPLFTHLNTMSTGTSSINAPVDNNLFIPEPSGVSLSGQITDTTGKTLTGVLINLTILGSMPYQQSTYSKSDGKFYFNMPTIKGEREVFLSAKTEDQQDIEILVDNDFSPTPQFEQLDTFELSKTRQELSEEMYLNMELANYYNLQEIGAPIALAGKAPVQFYGIPDKQIIIDDYIKLPSLEEYLLEFFNYVKVIKKGERRSIQIYNSQQVLNIQDPLILLDGVSLADYSGIWDLNMNKIQQIDVVYNPFVKGNSSYGGILQIITKNADFAGLKLPSSGLFFNYLFLHDSPIPIITPQSIHLPDSRITLLWQPHLTKNQGNFSFDTGNLIGKYCVTINGLSISGEKIFGECLFEIR